MSEYEKDEYEHLLGKPKSFTKGKIGNFFPSNKVNRLLTFKDEMNTIANDGFDTNPQNETAQYKELLMNLVKNKRNNRANAGRSINSRMGKEYIKPYFSNEILPNFSSVALQQQK